MGDVVVNYSISYPKKMATRCSIAATINLRVAQDIEQSSKI